MEWTENLTRLADFAATRGVDRNAVTQYVRYHPEIFSGHIAEHKRSLYGDDYALKALDDKYPLPKPVEVIKDPEADELRRQVIALQEQLLASQKQVISLTERAVQAESVQVLLEDKEKQLQTHSSRISDLENELKSSKLLLEETSSQLSGETSKRLAAEKRLEEFSHMGWLQRLFWKNNRDV